MECQVDQSEKTLVVFLQSIAFGDNGVDGQLAQQHVEGELSLQEEWLQKKQNMEEAFVMEKQPDTSLAAKILAQVWLDQIKIYSVSVDTLLVFVMDGTKWTSLKKPCFLLQWIAFGVNGVDGQLAQQHVEGELSLQEG